jgi:hypothetical protein
MTTTSAPELPAPARLSRKQRRAKRARESISSIPLSQPSPPSQPGPSKRPRLSRAPRNEALLAAQDPIPSEADDPPNETPSSSDYERLSFDEEPSSPLHEDGEVEPSSQPPLKKGKKKKKKKGKPSKPKPFSEPVSDPVAWLESKVLIEP